MISWLAVASSGHQYVILTSPRAGSTLLCDQLNALHIRCNYELLAGHEGNASLLMQIARHFHVPCDKPSTCKPGYLRQLLLAYYRACPAGQSCGFKFFPKHLPTNATFNALHFEELVQRVIVLERSNKTAQYESLVTAFRTGLWGPWQHGVPESYRLDYTQVGEQTFTTELSAFYDAYRHLRGIALMNVDFDDLIDEAKRPLVVAGVAAFIKGKNETQTPQW